MRIRAAAVCLVASTFAIGAVRAYGQASPPNPGTAGSLAARLAALEARVTALETIDESDIVGTYKWTALGISLNGGFAGAPGTPAQVKTEVADHVLTLNADHTVQVSGSIVDCALPLLAYALAHCQADEDEPSTLTWSFANGVVTISADPPEPGETLEFAVPASGVIVYGGSSEFQPGHTWATIGLLVKQPD